MQCFSVSVKGNILHRGAGVCIPKFMQVLAFGLEFGAEETVQTATEGETTALRAKFGKESLVLLVVAEILCCL